MFDYTKSLVLKEMTNVSDEELTKIASGLFDEAQRMVTIRENRRNLKAVEKGIDLEKTRIVSNEVYWWYTNMDEEEHVREFGFKRNRFTGNNNKLSVTLRSYENQLNHTNNFGQHQPSNGHKIVQEVPKCTNRYSNRPRQSCKIRNQSNYGILSCNSTDSRYSNSNCGIKRMPKNTLCYSGFKRQRTSTYDPYGKAY